MKNKDLEPVAPRGLPGPSGLEDLDRCGCGNKVGSGSWVSVQAQVSEHGRFHRADARVCYSCASRVIDRLATMESLRLFLLGIEAAERPGEPLGEPAPDLNPNSPGAGPVSKEGE